MNKKLIAIAVASVMAAPVAMADIKISGRVAQDFTILDTDTVNNDVRGVTDSGHTRLQFDGTVGQAYARIALDERLGRDNNTATSYTRTKRDSYVGYKLDGGMSIQVGRMAGAAKNLEKDQYIATFLETRSTIANSFTGGGYGSSSFIDSLVQLSFKAGAAKIKVQYDPSEYAGSPNSGHLGLSVAGKAGAIRYWASYNNGVADGLNPTPALTASPTNIKLGGEMKFGKVKASLNYTSMDNDGAVGFGNATDSIALAADMGLGNGLSANVAFATRSGDTSADDATFIRLAVTKKLGKGVKVYGGYTSTDYEVGGGNDTSEVGVGMLVKF